MMETTYVIKVRWFRGRTPDREISISSFQGTQGSYQDGEVVRTTSYSEAKAFEREYMGFPRAKLKRLQADMRLVHSIMER